MTQIAEKPAERWMTLGDACKLLNVSRPTLYRYISRTHAEIKYHKVDKRLRYVDVNFIKREIKR